jgi:biotin synthase-related radical SAM superfamily protein
VQELGPLPVNAHIRVTEGKDDFEVVLRAKQVTDGQIGQGDGTTGTSG